MPANRRKIDRIIPRTDKAITWVENTDPPTDEIEPIIMIKEINTIIEIELRINKTPESLS